MHRAVDLHEAVGFLVDGGVIHRRRRGTVQEVLDCADPAGRLGRAAEVGKAVFLGVQARVARGLQRCAAGHGDLDLLAHIKAKFPQVNIHGFSPSEFIHFRDVFNEPLEKIIADFHAAGLGSIPGGGGEILVDRVRKRIAPLKAMSNDWLAVMDVAHRLGLSSSATMMFGHVETIEDRIEHLERIRAQQDASGGFTAFIAWTFQAENTRLKAPTVGAHEYLRTQALSRIYLDNVPNIQSSWVTQGLEIGQVALRFGANDLGSIMIEENVVSQAGTTFRMGVADMQRLIRELGYEPHQRDNWYRLLN